MIKGITPEKLKIRQNSICKSKVLTMYIFEVLLMLTPELPSMLSSNDEGKLRLLKQ